MDVVKWAEQFSDLLYQINHEELTEKQENYLLDLMDKIQGNYISGSTGWIAIEAMKDFIKDKG
jgi:hypothetical protein